MITLEKVLSELKGESLNEIVGGTGGCQPPTDDCEPPTVDCKPKNNNGKKGNPPAWGKGGKKKNC